MVVVSIGGNNFDFGSVVEDCVLDFLTSPDWAKNLCSDDSSVVAAFDHHHRAVVRAKITHALVRVRQAMRDDGYRDRSWTLVVQTYPSPIPRGVDFRYPESGFTRQSVGGCGFWNADARWANTTALPAINHTVKAALADAHIAGAKVLNVAHAFDGRRLCESGVGLYEEEGLTSWTQPGAVNKTEWVNQIRTVSAAGRSPTASRSRCILTTGDSWRCGTACARSTTMVLLAEAPASSRGDGLRHGEPRMRLR